MNRAVFLDRDGTIIEDVGHLHSIEDVRVLPDVPEAIGRLNRDGWLVIVITNQSVIARGLLDESGLQEIHNSIDHTLSRAGAHIDAWYYCPHYENGVVRRYSVKCDCRKPRPGMLFKAMKEYNIRAEWSWTIGDKMSDVLAGRSAGTRSLLLGRDVLSLKEAVDLITGSS